MAVVANVYLGAVLWGSKEQLTTLVALNSKRRKLGTCHGARQGRPGADRGEEVGDHRGGGLRVQM